jgi:hypothetical protein
MGTVLELMRVNLYHQGIVPQAWNPNQHEAKYTGRNYHRLTSLVMTT